jgi:hypothetical protein
MVTQIQIAKAALDQARGTDGNERIANVDHYPDWMRARSQGGVSFMGGYNRGSPNDWDQIGFADNLFY